MQHSIALLGAGGWGTAICVPLTDNGHYVTMWSRNPEVIAELNQYHENRKYLPNVVLPRDRFRATEDIGETVCSSEVLILAVPSHAAEDVARRVRLYYSGQPIISLCKGLEVQSSKRISQVISEVIPQAAPRIVVISGPNFAVEVARRLPSATVAAASDIACAKLAQATLSTTRFRVYTSPDVVGVELGGALKNIIAIAVGISDGMGLGYNARAGLITRGIAEMSRFGTVLGAKPSTFAGLSGVGDLVLTCTGDYSRNRQAGMAIGKGEHVNDFLARTGFVVEGIRTAQAAYRLSQELGVEMPITAEVYRILFEGRDPRDGLESLMARNPRAEPEDERPSS